MLYLLLLAEKYILMEPILIRLLISLIIGVLDSPKDTSTIDIQAFRRTVYDTSGFYCHNL